MAEGKADIPMVEGAESLNELLTEFQGLQNEWSDLMTPIIDAKSACFKACGLAKTPGENIKHVLIGLPLALVSDAKMKLKDLKEQFEFTPDDLENPIKIKVVDKYEDIITSLSDWILGYIKAF